MRIWHAAQHAHVWHRRGFWEAPQATRNCPSLHRRSHAMNATKRVSTAPPI